MKHLLKMLDLSTEDITEILNLADQLKYEQKHGIEHRHLAGKTLGMIFEKASTRTRVSFEVGMYQLGGLPIFLSASDLQIGRGEPVEDTARVLSRYLDGIMIRTYKQSEVDALAQNGTIPDHQRPDGFCPSLPGVGGLDDYPGAQGQLGRPENVLHRRRQQYDEFPDRRLLEDEDGSGGRLPRTTISQTRWCSTSPYSIRRSASQTTRRKLHAAPTW